MAASVLLLPPRFAPLSPHPKPSPNSKKPLLLASLGRRAAAAARLRAVGDRGGLADQTVYNGFYGPWTVEDSDVREVRTRTPRSLPLFPLQLQSLKLLCLAQVLLYRSGLVTATASFIVAASAAFLPEENAAGDAIRQSIDLFYATGAAGLGLSLVLIHIYVTPIKRFLQALWVVGVLGSIGTYLAGAQPLDESLVQYVLEHPAALWFVGPTFAALTGLVFKEGIHTITMLINGGID